MDNSQDYLPEHKLNYETFIDKLTIFYGATGFGKSTVMRDGLYLLAPHVAQIIVFNPQESQNQTYTRGDMVPKALVHYRITDELLRRIWKRQEALVSVYEEANRPDVLEALFNKINSEGMPQARMLVSNLKERKARCERDIRDRWQNEVACQEKIDEISGRFNEFINTVYKKYITMHRDRFNLEALTPEERYALKYIALNPRLLLVFDDCSADLSKFKTHEVIQKLAFQGRWARITVFIAMHSHKLLPSELRINAKVSVFAEQRCAVGLFTAAANGFDQETKKRAMLAVEVAFAYQNEKTGSRRHQKLIYFNETNEFFRFTATKRGAFYFCCHVIREFASAVQSNGIHVDKNNEFVGLFR